MMNGKPKLKILFFICMFFLMAIPLTSAVELNPFAVVKTADKTRDTIPNLNDYFKSDFNSKYGIIRLSKTFLWFETDRVAEYSLTKNTDKCFIDCSASGKAILYSDGTLFEGIKFLDLNTKKDVLVNSKYYIKVIETYKEEIPIYEKFNCVKGTYHAEDCEYKIVGTNKIEKTREVWKEYNNEILSAGNYEWKLEGQKDSAKSVDWIAVSNGKELTEWAGWTSADCVGAGGNITIDGDYCIHTFPVSATFNATKLLGTNVTVLVIAGGGGGGNSDSFGGGGGAGGLIYITNYTLNATTLYTVTIGAGGLGGANGTLKNTQGTDGGFSVFGVLTALGGGGGAGGTGLQKGRSGGSGGGGTQGGIGGNATQNLSSGLSGLYGYGYKGGNESNCAISCGSGGGGGAGSRGNNTNSLENGAGGAGKIINITGENVCYAGGGGGTKISGAYAIATCGGGNGTKYPTYLAGFNGENGTGGGGGGGFSESVPIVYGSAGSGIVIVRYLIVSGGTPVGISTTLINPENAYSTQLTSLNFSANATARNGNLTNMTLYIWKSTDSIYSNNITNTTITGLFNQTTFSKISIGLGNYLWNIYACGTNATSYLCNFATANRTLTIIAFTENSLTFNSSTYDLFSEGFALDITYDSSVYSGITSYLNYNGTEYLATKTGTGGNVILSRNIYLPPITSAINKSFNFKINFININTGESINVTSSNGFQYVSPVDFVRCNSTITATYANFTLKDELLGTLINGNFLSTFNYNFGGGTPKNYSYSNNSNSVSNFNFCFSLPYKTIITNMDAGYSAIGYSDRTKYLRNASLSNATSQVELLLLNSSSSVKFFVEVTKNLVGIKDAIVVISKYNVGTGTYQTIGSRKTDDTGNFVEYMEIDKQYQFSISKDLVFLGLITKTSTCAATPCTFDLELTEAETDLWSGYYDIYATNVASNLTYDRTLKMVTYRFVDLTGLANYFRLEVNKINYNQTGANVCNNFSYTTAGELNCNLTGYEGDFKATSYISRSPEKIDEIIYIIQKAFKDIFGNEGLFFAVLIIIAVGLIGAWNPVVGVLLGAVAFFFVVTLGLVEVNYTVVALIFALAIFIIIKMGGRTQV